MIEVEIESTGDVLEFPDGTDPETIRAAAARHAQGRVASAGQSFMRGGGVATGQTVSGLARLGDLLGRSGMMIGPGGAVPMTDPRLVEDRKRQMDQTPTEREAQVQAMPLYQLGRDVTQGAEEAFQPNPRFAGEMFADVLPSAGGQMLPTIGAGLVNPVLAAGQYGLSAGQSAAQEAVESGRPDAAETAFVANVPIGALTEALLGVPANLRLLREAAKARGVLPAVGRGGLREGAQEGLEQIGQNLVASDVAGYDPERGMLEGVGTAIAAGALLGAGAGGVVGVAQRGQPIEGESPEVDAGQESPPLPPESDELPEGADVEPLVEALPVDPTAIVPPADPVQQPTGETPLDAAQSVAEPAAAADVPEIGFGNIQTPQGQQASPPPAAVSPVQPATQPVPAPAAAMAIPPEPSVIQLYGSRALARLDAMDTALKSAAYSDPLLLTQFARVAVQAAQVLVRGGMALDQAIRNAVAQARQQIPDAPDNDDALMEAMSRGLGVRQMTEQIDADPSVSDQVRSQVGNRLYVREPNEDSVTFAGRILDQVGGLEQGILVYRDRGNGLDGGARTALATLVGKRMAEAERAARSAGRIQEADELAARQAAFYDEDVLPTSTSLARELQAFSLFRFITPQATIQWARRQIERAGRAIREESGATTGALVESFDAQNQQAIDGVLRTTPVQEQAGAAVDEAVQAEAWQATGPVADALRIEATNNLDMLASVREARTQARVRALQQVAKQSGYWQRIVNTSSRQLERLLRGRLAGGGGRVAADTVSTLASRMTEVLGRQLDVALGRQPSPVNRTRPDHLLRLRQLLENSERMSQIWGQVRAEIAADPALAADPRVQQVLATPFDVWSDALLRRVIDQSLEAQDITLRELLRNHYRLRQGALGERLVRELGMDPQLAGRITAAADAAYREALQQAQSRVPARLQRLRRDPTLIRALRTGLVEEGPDAEVDRALADAMTRARVRLGRLVRQHYRQVDAQGRSLADRLVQDAGVSGAVAARLQQQVAQQFANRLAEARQREINRIIASGTPVTRQVRQQWERLVEMANLGAINNASAWAAIQDRLGLPRWTPELAADISRLADAIQTAPEGIPQQRAVQALLDRIARAGLRWWDFPIAFWYANVLSGPITQARNLLGNLTNLMATGIVSARRPQDWPAQMAAAARGFRLGSRDAWDILRTGRITGARSLRAEAARPMELARLSGRLDYLLTPWRAVGRALAATDTLFFRAGYEQRAELLARLVARREGLRGDALARRTAEILARLPAQRQAATQTALSEGLSGNDLQRRVADILDRSRPDPIRENARQFGLRVTFNQEPYGVLGAVARGINRISDEVPALRLIVPFTNVVANVVNDGLNYFPPAGIYRAVRGHLSGELEGRPITNDEDLYDQHAKAALGVLSMVGLWAVAAAAADEDDPWFSISAVGPADPRQRNQLRLQGWIPHSVKIGDRYYSYANTPMAMPMAVLGNWFDAVRYRKLDDQSLFNRLAFAMATSAHVIIEQSFLDGITRLLSGLDRNDAKASGKLFEGLARTASSAVIPNAVRQVDRMFDPTVYDSPSVEAALINAIPFARRTGQPAVNVWGEPVRIATTSAFTSEAEPDPVISTLARKGLWISTPGPQTHVAGKPLTPEEVYVYTVARGPRLREYLSRPEVLARFDQLPPDQAGRLLERYQDAASRWGNAAVLKYRRSQAAR